MTKQNALVDIAKRPRVQLLCQFLLGGIFIYASLGKILYPSAFVDIVKNYRILSDSLVNPVARILPWLELIFGLFLVLHFLKKISAGVLSFLLIAFIAVLGFNLIRGVNVNCGCLFQNQPESASSSSDMVISIVRDFLLLIPGILIIFFSKCRRD